MYTEKATSHYILLATWLKDITPVSPFPNAKGLRSRVSAAANTSLASWGPWPWPSASSSSPLQKDSCRVKALRHTPIVLKCSKKIWNSKVNILEPLYSTMEKYLSSFKSHRLRAVLKEHGRGLRWWRWGGERLEAHLTEVAQLHLSRLRKCFLEDKIREQKIHQVNSLRCPYSTGNVQPQKLILLKK